MGDDDAETTPLLLAWRPTLTSLTLNLFLRALFAWQRRCAKRQGVPNPQCGAVTCIQRFGSALNLNLHFHTLVPDGVFFEDADGAMQFHALAPPTRGELEKLLRRLVPRLLRRLAAEPEFPAAEPWLHLLVQALQPGALRPVDDPPRGLCVLADGFSLHAGVIVRELDGDALERLARYCARPALALGRLSLSPDGQVLYRVKHAAPGIPRLLRLSPTEFLGRIAALMPPPRAHLVRFHGVFAPHSKSRARIVPAIPLSSEPVALPPQQAPSPDTPKGVPQEPPLPGSPTPQHKVPPARTSPRLDWATLLRRSFAIDVLHCERWGGRRRLCALITEENTPTRFLPIWACRQKPLLNRRPESRPSLRSPRVSASKTASIPSRRPGTPKLAPKSCLPRAASPVGPRQRSTLSHIWLRKSVIFPT